MWEISTGTTSFTASTSYSKFSNLPDLTALAWVWCETQANSCGLLKVNSGTGANMALHSINYTGSNNFAPGFQL